MNLCYIEAGQFSLFCTVLSVTFVANEFLPSIACNSQDEPFSFSLQLKLYSRNLNKSKKSQLLQQMLAQFQKNRQKASRTGRPVCDAKRPLKSEIPSENTNFLNAICLYGQKVSLS